ncbi:hypothetical protein QLH52_07015 [Methylomonas sp. OY6]|uniref:Uncharacterized protein n=1 Tax=Methylomonas defluvii TaxID=3045149 RepID=A0ABU4UC68_9GAMM|nr:hypothetical protein [Methylomonas sp. OY6]MDX8127023.1 hypothetical protein [Methylomonas sp. OY6]
MINLFEFFFVLLIAWLTVTTLLARKRRLDILSGFNATEVVVGPTQSAMAINIQTQKIMLVNINIYLESTNGNIISSLKTWVSFSVENVEAIDVLAFTNVNASVHFKFYEPIGSWNHDRSLTYYGSPNVRPFLKKYFPNTPITWQYKTKDEKILPWTDSL